MDTAKQQPLRGHSPLETCTAQWCTAGALGYPYEHESTQDEFTNTRCQGFVHAQWKDLVDEKSYSITEFCDECPYEFVRIVMISHGLGRTER